MTLYSDPNNAQSHRVRIVLGEKDLVFKIEEVLSGQNNEDLIALNPNNTTPTFVDRNLVLYESRVIMEYLDERFPHPPLMPVDPVIRAKTRMVLHYIEKDLYGLLDDVKSSGEKKSSAAKQKLKENLLLSLDFIQGKKYFLSDDFSIIDCSMAPILWRLPEFGIELPKSAKPIIKYSERLFERSSFLENLSEQEEEIRSNY
ncbi:MAG: stringent starvation protein A [Gammaproteobacteria bacterium]|jgi:RNA polymerase-associated protein|nr:stringent starvation protein A [Gammaproteobacteria bacterium]MEE2693282.1 glutathione S-transferase N-terminal domain-containing protein [Pseudomonadota bacterium]|tara:strand:- start:876 stop:1478 length:603 start_codon:yes stop_codon:yes gene_type:complete